MKIFHYLVWICAGAGLAITNFITQYLSVRVIHPRKENRSKWLILGGAVLRWLLVGTIFIIALSYSIISMLIVFFSFLVVRLFVLYIYTPRWHIVQDKMD